MPPRIGVPLMMRSTVRRPMPVMPGMRRSLARLRRRGRLRSHKKHRSHCQDQQSCKQFHGESS
jgi:hypothetical protein